LTMAEMIVRVDEEDRVLGPIDRLEAHRGDGVLHRGLMVVVKNRGSQVLLTQRSERRPDLDFPPPFPGFWDLTLAGHPKWGQTDYTTQMAVELAEEIGIRAKAADIEYVGKFQYHAPDSTYPNERSPPGFRLSEFEICGVGTIETDSQPKLNTVEIQRSAWVRISELEGELKSLKMAPWATIMKSRFPRLFE
jgi:isopentenyl-diphosphate Delta-isomerase